MELAQDHVQWLALVLLVLNPENCVFSKFNSQTSELWLLKFNHE
jgi:hypothetical protein